MLAHARQHMVSYIKSKAIQIQSFFYFPIYMLFTKLVLYIAHPTADASLANLSDGGHRTPWHHDVNSRSGLQDRSLPVHSRSPG